MAPESNPNRRLILSASLIVRQTVICHWNICTLRLCAPRLNHWSSPAVRFCRASNRRPPEDPQLPRPPPPGVLRSPGHSRISMTALPSGRTSLSAASGQKPQSVGSGERRSGPVTATGSVGGNRVLGYHPLASRLPAGEVSGPWSTSEPVFAVRDLITGRAEPSFTLQIRLTGDRLECPGPSSLPAQLHSRSPPFGY